MMRLLLIVVSMILGFRALPAESVVITDGFFLAQVVDDTAPRFNLLGSAFTFTGFPPDSGNTGFPPAVWHIGDTVTLGVNATLLPFNPLTYQGTTYPFSEGTFHFQTAPMTIQCCSAQVSLPFTFDGTALGRLAPPGPGAASPIAVPLTGQGTATASLLFLPGNVVDQRSFRYDFQAVPEPSTWLMLGSGLAVLSFLRRRLLA